MIRTCQAKLEQLDTIAPTAAIMPAVGARRAMRLEPSKSGRSARTASAPKKQRLNEAEIKAIILTLPEFRKYRPIVASEFVVGPRIRRADLVIQRDDLIAFEIKSDFDNLLRLQAQTKEYANYFNKVIVVVTSKHVIKTLDMLSDDFEVWEVDSERRINIVRRASSCLMRSPRNLLRLLTKAEKQRYLGKDLLPDLFLTEAQLVKSAAAEAFAARHGFCSKRFWKAVGRKKVQPDHLEHLSRFSENRKRAATQAAKAEDFWKSWQQATSEFLDLTISAGSLD